jgi:heat shock protein HslJ
MYLACCLLALALLLPACECAACELAGSQWELKSYGPENNQSMVLAGTRVTLAFNEIADGISGRAGCNSYGGECYVRGDKIDFYDIFQTEMACQDPAGIMLQESSYLTLLGKAERYNVNAGELRIYTRDQGLLVFARSLIPAGSKWELKTLGAQNAQAAVLAGTRITLDFNTALTGITGSAGCNTYSADAVVEDARITISNISQTKRNCTNPEGIMIQEDTFLNLLRAALSFEFMSGEFIIYAGGGMLVFAPAD